MAGDVSPKSVAELWDVVDAHFDASGMFGPVAEKIEALSAKVCAHAWSYGMALQTALLGCVNGAKILAWDKASPLSQVAIVVNPPQTRKSGITSVIADIGRQLDRQTRKPRDGDNLPKAPPSCLLTKFTEAALFERCSAKAAAERGNFCTLLSVDESYRFLRYLGLSEQTTSGPTDSASDFNRLLQTGEIESATKTCGSYEAGGKSCNIVGLGNLHVNRFVQLVLGKTGFHDLASMERLIFLMARPISSHSALPQSLNLPPGYERFIWVPLLDVMLPSLGLNTDALHLTTARRRFEEAEMSDECPTFHVELADGTESRLRFRSVATRSQEWGIPAIFREWGPRT